MKNKLSILSCQLSEEAARAGAEVFVVLIAGVGLDKFGVGLGASAGGEQGSDYPFAQDHQEQSWLVALREVARSGVRLRSSPPCSCLGVS
jgi:hypothetical protein